MSNIKDRAYSSFQNAKSIAKSKAKSAKDAAGNAVKKAGDKAGNKVARLSSLTSEQLEDVRKLREFYFEKMKLPNDTEGEEFTSRLLASTGVEIYNAHLSQLSEIYVPLNEELEYERIELDDEGKPKAPIYPKFNTDFNIRYINITRWVTDKTEDSLEKLVNVYEVLSNEDCNIALVFNRKQDRTDVYLAVTNKRNDENHTMAESYKKRLIDAIRGNFPGSEIGIEGRGVLPCLDSNKRYSVASVSNVPTEKSEKFISQTIEKLLDGIIPDDSSKEYTLILLATPARDIQNRKLRLAELYSGLAPYAGWQTNFTYVQSDSRGSSATFGVNAGVSAGVQHGNTVTNSESLANTDNQNTTNTQSRNQSNNIYESDTNTDSSSQGVTNQTGSSTTDSYGQSVTDVSSTTNSSMTTDSVSDSTNWSNASTDGYSDNISITEGLAATEGANAGAVVTATESVASTQANGTNHSDTFTNGGGQSITQAIAEGVSNTVGRNITNTVNRAITSSVSQAITSTTGTAISRTLGSGRTTGTGSSVARSIGKAITSTASTAAGIYKGTNFGGNFGANFARSSNVTATIGSNEGITQSFTNYTVKHTLEILEEQMKRYEESTALGMWDFAAYVLSEDHDVASNVAHSYLALTQGEKSYVTEAAINVWRGDITESGEAEEICKYLRMFRHPIFGLDPYVALMEPYYNVYPSVVTATTNLSGKELAYSLNFPKHSIAGLPVIECTEFGRNISSYDSDNKVTPDNELRIGKIFHMNKVEKLPVRLNIDSLASHTFITGSTGSGKSNTVYKILEEAMDKGIHFMVIEPAKGEYKQVFGGKSNVSVYGTNPLIFDLLRINPFSFPKGIHVLEHLDRLIEIFNVCWPMYAAMPAVLKNAVEKAYEDCGWDLVESSNNYGENLYPTFADVTRNVREIIDSSEYDRENKGAYKGSLITRLQSLTNGINGMIFTTNELSSEMLFDGNTIIDLSRVGSSETKSLIMGMMVLKLQEYRMTSVNYMNSNLQHLTVLEEAHNILKRTSYDNSSEGGNLLGKSVEMISNAIAEMRTYGEGFVVVDQAPNLLDMASIRNTNTKIIMRLPDLGDRNLVGKAAGLNDDQIIELAKLPKGVAAIYQNDWVTPILCKVDKYDEDAEPYVYDKVSKITVDNKGDSLAILSLLSNGSKLSKESVVNEIKPKLDSIGVSASVQRIIYDMLMNPASEPRMTKFGRIVAELLPDTVRQVESTFSVSRIPSDWTKAVEDYISQYDIPNQVRRDIIQSAITYYFMYVINDSKSLRDWSEKGGLR